MADKEDFIKELKKCINHESLQFSPEVPLHEESQDTVDLSVNKEVWLVHANVCYI